MSITLDRLPLDALFCITEYLLSDDLRSLGQTSLRLKGLLYQNAICRKLIETQFQRTKEAQLARNKRISYDEALRRIHDRRAALSNANPFSARIVGRGNDFRCNHEVLCILEGNTIRISDIYGQSEDITIDLSTVIATTATTSSSSEPKVSLLSFNDDIVTIHYMERAPLISRICAISTKREPLRGNRLVKEVSLLSSYKLFARHTAKYLYYGTYSALGVHGHHEWEIRGIPLDDEFHIPSHPLQLEEFFGTDIGSTVAFEIHNDHFYAVSNQTSFEVEEIDWTSFYHCIRFPLNHPVRNKMEANREVYRRQHSEGPIHDSWLDLTLQFDEHTDQPVIVEARSEWPGGSSSRTRNFYISHIKWKSHSPRPSALLLPMNDPYLKVLDDSNKPNYAPEQPRSNWSVHTESTVGRRFRLAETKFRGYNYPCGSFLDLVEDEKCCNGSRLPCLRIRVGSRRVAPVGWISPTNNSANPSAPLHDTVFRNSSIKLWPPPASTCACSQKLHEILNPPLPEGPAYGRYVTGFLDKYCLVYMICSRPSYNTSGGNTLGVIVIINFSREHERTVEERSPSHWDWVAGSCRIGTC